jgi:hypothetical protein
MKITRHTYQGRKLSGRFAHLVCLVERWAKLALEKRCSLREPLSSFGADLRGHAIHLALELRRRDWPPPLIGEPLRIAQVFLNLLLHLLEREHRIERRFPSRIFFRPNPMSPIHFLDRVLIGDTFCKAQAGACCTGFALPLGSKGNARVTRLTRKRHVVRLRIRLVMAAGFLAKSLFTCRAKNRRYHDAHRVTSWSDGLLLALVLASKIVAILSVHDLY